MERETYSNLLNNVYKIKQEIFELLQKMEKEEDLKKRGEIAQLVSELVNGMIACYDNGIVEDMTIQQASTYSDSPNALPRNAIR